MEPGIKEIVGKALERLITEVDRDLSIRTLISKHLRVFSVELDGDGNIHDSEGVVVGRLGKYSYAEGRVTYEVEGLSPLHYLDIELKIDTSDL